METRRILIINGHPDAAPARLCAGLAEAYARGALSCGHEVRRASLGALDVPLLASQAEFDTPPAAHIAALQADLGWANHLVLVFPLWLGGAPAKLKALLEQLMRHGFGFQTDGSYSMRHLSVGHDEPLRAELIAFLDAVRTGKVPAVTGDEGVASLEIAIKCLEVPAGSIAAPLRKGPRAVAS